MTHKLITRCGRQTEQRYAILARVRVIGGETATTHAVDEAKSIRKAWAIMEQRAVIIEWVNPIWVTKALGSLKSSHPHVRNKRLCAVLAMLNNESPVLYFNTHVFSSKIVGLLQKTWVRLNDRPARLSVVVYAKCLKIPFV